MAFRIITSVSKTAVRSQVPNKLSATTTMQRGLSSQGSAALGRLRSALEEYRCENYQQELPSRFKKDIVKAARRASAQDVINNSDLHRVIRNIDLQDRVTSDDIDMLFRELGDVDSGTMSVSKMLTVL